MIKLLVVDDEKGMTEQLKDFLEDRGFKVFAATSGKQGIEILNKEKPNIMILDILMPEIDGIEVLREVKKINPKTRVVMLTAVDDLKTKNIALGLGACDYLTKPYSFDQVDKTIRKIIADICKEEGVL